MKVKSHLDFEGKAQLIKITVEKVATTLPTGWEGRMIYRESDDQLYWHNGTAWVAVGNTSGLITAVNAGGGITVSGSGAVTVSADPDAATLELSDGTATAKLRIKDAGVSAQKIASDAVTTVKILDKNVTFAKIEDVASMTVIGRVAAGSGVTSAITILTDLDTTIASHDSLASAKSIKAYIDGIIGGLGELQGGWDANTQSTFPSGAVKGDYWYITAAGAIQGVNFDAGDVIIANKTDASTTLPADWITLEVNREQATETAKGVAEIATQAEVNAGTDDQRIVTPLKLATYVAAELDDFGKYSANMGNNLATQFAVTHSLNSRDVLTEVYDTSTYETVLATVARTTVNQVTVTFAEAPATDAYRIVIWK